MNENANSRRKSTVLFCSALAFVCLVASVLVSLSSLYISVAGERYRISLSSIDLRGKTVSVEDYRMLRSKMPNCDIIWDVPIGGARCDSTSAELSLAGLTAADVELLKETLGCFNNIKSVVLSDCELCPQLLELATAYPNCDISWDVIINGTTYNSSVQQITLTDTAAADLDRIAYLPKLTDIDASECSDYGVIASLVEKYGDKNLIYSMKLLNSEISSLDETGSISGQTVADLDDFKARLGLLPKLKKLDMCGCGLSNEQMEDLMVSFPDKKLVWFINFGRWKNVRTDILCFSTLNSFENPYDEETFAPLFNYCTDLVAIDLGHNSIRDISGVANLKKLQVAVLALNRFTDCSPVAELKELVYLEIFSNRIEDPTPLATLPKLETLLMAKNGFDFQFKDPITMDDISFINVFYQQKTLKKFQFYAAHLPEEDKAAIRAKMSYCIVSFGDTMDKDSEGNPVDFLWRDSTEKRYIRYAFHNWPYIVEYTDMNHYKFAEGAPLEWTLHAEPAPGSVWPYED